MKPYDDPLNKGLPEPKDPPKPRRVPRNKWEDDPNLVGGTRRRPRQDKSEGFPWENMIS